MTVSPVLIAEGTRNDNPNPTFATTINGWSTGGQSSSLAGGWAWHDGPDTSMRFSLTSSTGAGSSTYGTSTAAGTYAAGDPVTISAHLTSSGIVGAVQLQIQPRDAGGGYLTAVPGDIVPLTGVEQDVTFTVPALQATTDRVLGSVRVHVDGAQGAATVDVFWVQIEKKNHATAFTTGTRPDRYAPGFLTIGSPHIGPLRVGTKG